MTSFPHSSRLTTSTNAIICWWLASIVPFVPCTLPLFQGSLSDSPRAYLIWIPALAFAWAGWELHRAEPVLRATTSWPGIPLMLVSGGIAASIYFLPSSFVSFDAVLLIWPLWSLGMLWMVFGVERTRIIAKPMIYLLLVWPPFFNTAITFVNPSLQHLAVACIQALSRSMDWLQPSNVYGVFDVSTPTGAIVHVSITAACSGSDSVLALIILFPVMLVLFQVRVSTKFILVATGCVGALIANLLRLYAILWALHLFGYEFAFGILHPLLGTVLFLVLASLLLLFGSRKSVVATRTRQEHGYTIDRRNVLSTAVVSLILTGLLFPLYGWSAGSALHPIHVRTTEQSAWLPDVSGYHRRAQARGGGHPPTAAYSSATYTATSGRTIQASVWVTNSSFTFHPQNQSLSGKWNNAKRLSRKRVPINNGISGAKSVFVQSTTQAHQSRSVYVLTAYDFHVVYQYRQKTVRVELFSTYRASADTKTVDDEYGKIQSNMARAIVKQVSRSNLD